MLVCLQWNVSPKFLVHSSPGLSHLNKAQCKFQTNSPQKDGVRFESPCPIWLSMMQKNCWLVAESNLEKRYRTRLKKIVILKSKKCFSLRKLTKMSNLIICFSEIPKIFLCVRVSQVAYLRTERSCPSEAVSSF